MDLDHPHSHMDPETGRHEPESHPIQEQHKDKMSTTGNLPMYDLFLHWMSLPCAEKEIKSSLVQVKPGCLQEEEQQQQWEETQQPKTPTGRDNDKDAVMQENEETATTMDKEKSEHYHHPPHQHQHNDAHNGLIPVETQTEEEGDEVKQKLLINIATEDMQSMMTLHTQPSTTTSAAPSPSSLASSSASLAATPTPPVATTNTQRSISPPSTSPTHHHHAHHKISLRVDTERFSPLSMSSASSTSSSPRSGSPSPSSEHPLQQGDLALHSTQGQHSPHKKRKANNQSSTQSSSTTSSSNSTSPPAANSVPVNPPSPSSPNTHTRTTTAEKGTTASPSPPRSPRGSTPPRSPSANRSPSGTVTVKEVSPPSSTSASIQKFYFPNGVPPSPSTMKKDAELIHSLFVKAQLLQEQTDKTADEEKQATPQEHHLQRLAVSKEELYPLTTQVCGLSSYCNGVLYAALLLYSTEKFPHYHSQHHNKAEEEKDHQHADAAKAARTGDMSNSSSPVSITASIDFAASSPTGIDRVNSIATTTASTPTADSGNDLIYEDVFLAFYAQHLQPYDLSTRLFRLLRLSSPSSTHPRYLTRDSFKLLLNDIVSRHPGLEFLEATPEFQVKYAQTVIARIFYHINRSGTELMSCYELQHSNFLLMLSLLDQEDDINKLNDYFSYEHFYVIYCKFWELDSDHDGYIDSSDLASYDDYALTSKIIDRIMNGYGRPLLSPYPQKMNYLDFIIFLISEVDKNNAISIQYWYNCLDIDHDGLLSAYELEYFFEEQKQRIQALSQEQIIFMDILCQLMDMIKNDHVALYTSVGLTKKDVMQSRLAANFFNTLFNLNKFIQSEQRDPVRIKQIHDTPQLSDWDRYAISGYYRLAEVDGEGAEAGETEPLETGEDIDIDQEHQPLQQQHPHEQQASQDDDDNQGMSIEEREAQQIHHSRHYRQQHSHRMSLGRGRGGAEDDVDDDHHVDADADDDDDDFAPAQPKGSWFNSRVSRGAGPAAYEEDADVEQEEHNRPGNNTNTQTQERQHNNQNNSHPTTTPATNNNNNNSARPETQQQQQPAVAMDVDDYDKH